MLKAAISLNLVLALVWLDSSCCTCAVEISLTHNLNPCCLNYWDVARKMPFFLSWDATNYSNLTKEQWPIWKCRGFYFLANLIGLWTLFSLPTPTNHCFMVLSWCTNYQFEYHCNMVSMKGGLQESSLCFVRVELDWSTTKGFWDRIPNTNITGGNLIHWLNMSSGSRS